MLVVLLAGAAVAASSPACPVVHHTVRVESMDPTTGRVEVSDEVRLERAPASGEPWRFLLAKDLAVDAVSAGDETLKLTPAERFDPRHFWKRPPYAELEGWDIARELEVQPPGAGWGAAPPVLRLHYTGVIADSLHAPVREYGRSFESTSGRVVPQGAFLSAATFWIPWSGEGLFTFDVTVASPAEWRTLSQGDLVEDAERDGERVMRWRCDAPSDEIYLVSGPYGIRRRDHAGVSLETWCYAGTDSTVSDPYLDAAEEAIDRYSAQYGKYAFSKFAMVENYWQTGFGMPGFTLLGDRVIRLPFIVHTSYPHEILHNWWGNGVYVDREQGNWCEGLTTYGADYAAKEAEGPGAARDYRRDALVGYRDFAAAGGKDFPLVRFRERDSAATQAVGYGKTLMVFHMLRRAVGDDAFTASLRRLYRTRCFREAGWDDVRGAFEAETGRDLGAWFDQWVQRPGAPALALEDVSVKASGKRRVVRGTLVQAAPTFALSVPFVVRGKDAHKDAEVAVRGERTPFEIPVEFAPLSVAADPEFQLFRQLHDGEVAPTLSGVLGAKAVRVVLGADATGALRDALVSAAKEWAKDTTVVVVEEGSGGALADFEGGTWFFGDGPGARAFLAVTPAPPETVGGGAVVLAGRLRDDPDRPAGAIAGAGLTPEAVAGIVRKVPHYSKYSWLAFDGDRNVGKGVWDPGASPLVVTFVDAGGAGGGR